MILVDTSFWIEFLRKRKRTKVISPNVFESFLTCPPVIQEVFQGLKPSPEASIFREQFLFIPRLGDPVPLQRYLEASDIYAQGRKVGKTVRSSVDCLIAAIAIHAKVPVVHIDRDFDVISSFTSLSVKSASSLLF